MNSQDVYRAIKLFNQEYIPFPPFDTAVKAIISNITQYRETGLAENIRVLGESGAGKSSLCEWIEHQYPRSSLIDRDLVPALVVSVPPLASISSLAESILEKLGDPSPLTGKVSTKTARVITLCRACKVEVILFDETQHIHDRGKYTTHYMVGDWLKSLIDHVGVPTVFVGLPKLEKLLQVNEQLRRRFSKRYSLALGQSGTETIESECFQLFNTLGNTMPIPISYSQYNWQEMGQRLFYASDGRIGYIKKIMKNALNHALKNDEPQICPEILEQAFTEEVWWEGVGELNPFNPAFIFRRLDRANEPFELGNINLSIKVR
jgi:hypothetical protein